MRFLSFFTESSLMLKKNIHTIIMIWAFCCKLIFPFIDFERFELGYQTRNDMCFGWREWMWKINYCKTHSAILWCLCWICEFQCCLESFVTCFVEKNKRRIKFIEIYFLCYLHGKLYLIQTNKMLRNSKDHNDLNRYLLRLVPIWQVYTQIYEMQWNLSIFDVIYI